MKMKEIIEARRTVRKYQNRNIPRKSIMEIINAGRWAVSAHNIQPWEFVVTCRKKEIEKIAKVMNKKSERLLCGFNIVMRDAAENLKNAPCIIAVYSNGAMRKKYSRFGEPYNDLAITYEIQSVAAAAENMLLYGSSIGLGMAWYGMALFCAEEINEIFEKKSELMAILAAGYPDEKPNSPSRKEIRDIAIFR